MDQITSLRGVEKTIAIAYADAWSKDPKAQDMRDLDVMSRYPVSIDKAVEIMKKYVPEGYNSFEAGQLNELKKIDPEATIYLGREGSPVVYVRSDKVQDILAKEQELKESMKFSEFDPHGNDEVRIWWD
jgi:hypothetical protein